MKDHSEAFVALDTSKLRNAVAIAESGRSGEVRFLGEIAAIMQRFDRFAAPSAVRLNRFHFRVIGDAAHRLRRRARGWGGEGLRVDERV